jgi:hypothetical protein
MHKTKKISLLRIGCYYRDLINIREKRRKKHTDLFSVKEKKTGLKVKIQLNDVI